ncbi:MAG: hypothetical protein Q9227_008311 [Pyrenula ochraceoflavens]
MATVRQQPKWTPPATSSLANPHPDLKVHNSLTRSKNQFVPATPGLVTWYACGPTVYDDAHLGHARAYVTQDILRRILRDFFGFSVHYVQNVTDVDDKIILKARQRFLFDRFRAESGNTINANVRQVLEESYHTYLRKRLPLINSSAPPEPQDFELAAQQAYAEALSPEKAGDEQAKIKMHINTIKSAVTTYTSSVSMTSEEFFEAIRDVVSPFLDQTEGARINSKDHTIFSKLTREYEQLFDRDMRDLNVLVPDEITRVTEYMEEIVEFVEKTINKGFAYRTSDGSVYFDIIEFEKAGYPYARLEPWNRNDKDLQADGEGALSKATAQKKSDADFALWKASKPGEPAWPSPFSEGRPGWHIGEP